MPAHLSTGERARWDPLIEPPLTLGQIRSRMTNAIAGISSRRRKGQRRNSAQCELVEGEISRVFCAGCLLGRMPKKISKPTGLVLETNPARSIGVPHFFGRCSLAAFPV
jgi:hypothetical protein